MIRRALLLLLCFLPLAGCSGGSKARIDDCLAALTALEPGISTLFIDRIGTKSDGIAILYRRDNDFSPSRIQCVFEEGLTPLGHPDLAGVTFNGDELGAGRLTFLKTHWLRSEGPGEVEKRVIRSEGDEDNVLFTVQDNLALQLDLQLAMAFAAYALLALSFAVIWGAVASGAGKASERERVIGLAGYTALLAVAALSAELSTLTAFCFAALAAGLAAWRSGKGAVFPFLKPRSWVLLIVAFAIAGILALIASLQLRMVPSGEGAIASVLGALIFLVGIVMLQRATRFGKSWREAARGAASSASGPVPAKLLLVSVLLSLTLAVPAAFVLLFGYRAPDLAAAFLFTMKPMFIALLAGAGAIWVTLAGALLLAVFDVGLFFLFGPPVGSAVMLVILVALLTLAPNGLFGPRRT